MDLKEIAKLIILQVDHNRDCGKEDCFTIDEVADIIYRKVNNVVLDDVIKCDACEEPSYVSPYNLCYHHQSTAQWE